MIIQQNISLLRVKPRTVTFKFATLCKKNYTASLNSKDWEKIDLSQNLLFDIASFSLVIIIKNHQILNFQLQWYMQSTIFALNAKDLSKFSFLVGNYQSARPALMIKRTDSKLAGQLQNLQINATMGFKDN